MDSADTEHGRADALAVYRDPLDSGDPLAATSFHRGAAEEDDMATPLSPVPGSPASYHTPLTAHSPVFPPASSSASPAPGSPNLAAHPNDVSSDPDHRLRLCRSATETMHIVVSEDDRRRAAKKHRLRGPGHHHLRRRFTLGAAGGTLRRNRADSQGTTSTTTSPAKKTSGSISKSFSAQLLHRAHSLSTRHRTTTAATSSTAQTASSAPTDDGVDEHTENLRELEDSPAADMHRSRHHGCKGKKAKRRSRLVPKLPHPTTIAEADETGGAKRAADGSKGGWFTRLFHPGKVGDGKGKAKEEKGEGTEHGGRSVFVNMPLPCSERNPKGRMRAKFPRNKVRTTKYTIMTFLPKNLAEQFHNVANVYFLALVVLQVFPIFGAAAPQIAMLPLVFILSVTAIKDAFEDYRRYVIDSGVNNSPCTRLGDWNNVNDERGASGWAEWWDRLHWPWEEAVGGNQTVFGAKKRKISKGVRRLRDKDKDGFDARFLRSQHRGKSTAGLDGRPSTATSTVDRLSDIGTVTPNLGASRATFTDSPDPARAAGGIVDWSMRVPGTAKWERTLWKKLVVGDLVLLREDEAVPADLLVIATSDQDGTGQCFVETKNLDGETNLKPRRAVKATQLAGIKDEEDLERARFVVESERQGANLYSYKGTLRYWVPKDGDEEMEEKKESVGINELLLRGCTLRNTQWVLGLVLFTGKDTKIMLNQGDTPSKRPKIAGETNFNVLANFVILVGLCAACAVGDAVLQTSTTSSAYFFEQDVTVDHSVVLDALVTLGAALIVFQSIVPISLVITLELVRTIQAFFILQDLDMYYEPLDHPCVPKSWNLSDDLGQIAYVFSDKTGTLTQNVMEFQRCSVGGKPYGQGVTEAMKGSLKKTPGALDTLPDDETLAKLKQEMIVKMAKSFDNRYIDDEALTLVAPDMIDDLTTDLAQGARLTAFWRALALCHDVLASTDEHDPFAIDYKAESPDEAALVAAARDVGFVFVNKTHSSVEIEVKGETERYVPLRTLDFNSSRKRMSVVVRCPDGKARLFCKGADSIIMARLKADHDMEHKAATQRDLENFANSGLRTLVVAQREMSDGQLARFLAAHDKAMLAGKNRDEEMERIADGVERELTILGATALEDKLQEGVPEAIKQLHQAGLKLWILTGDKLQTAIEIGFSCNLLTNAMEIMIISSDGEEGARSQIEQALDKLLKHHPLSGGAGDDEKAARPKDGYAVVIDGDTLRYALDASLKKQFLALTIQCETVVCCRVSPAQKALTVKLVKDGCRAMTLAIGDGANDVAMIQEANIGVGIAGLEGAQASMSADYAIGQFRYLSNLLLVHGRWCYLRIADMHTGFFFKNGVFTFTLFWYQIYCSWNSSYLFDYTLIMLFNLVFTSLPVGMLGIFEQDVDAKSSMAHPALYQVGTKGTLYTRVVFLFAMLDSVYQSCVCFWVPYFAYHGIGTPNTSGHDVSIWEFGSCVAVGAVLVANNFIALQTRYWTWIIFVIMIASSLTVFIWIAIYSQFQTIFFQNVVSYLFPTLPFWSSIFLVQILALLPRFVWHFAQLRYRPTVADMIRELVLCSPKASTADRLEVGETWKESKPHTPTRPKGGKPEAHEMVSVGGETFAVPTIAVSGTASQDVLNVGPYTSSSAVSSTSFVGERSPRIRTETFESATSQDALAHHHRDASSPEPISPTSDDHLRSRPTSPASVIEPPLSATSWTTALGDEGSSTFNHSRVA